MLPFNAASPRSSPSLALSTGNSERVEPPACSTLCARRTTPTSSEPSSSSGRGRSEVLLATRSEQASTDHLSVARELTRGPRRRANAFARSGPVAQQFHEAACALHTEEVGHIQLGEGRIARHLACKDLAMGGDHLTGHQRGQVGIAPQVRIRSRCVRSETIGRARTIWIALASDL